VRTQIIVAAALLFGTPVNAETLLVQSHNGTLSVIRDLDAKTCQQIICRLRLQTTCFPSRCTEDGELIQLNPSLKTCARVTTGNEPEMMECLK
jgi:hypothetical protein